MKYSDMFTRLMTHTKEVMVKEDLGPCYEWTAACGRDGYGKMSIREDGKVKKKKPHRVMVETVRGRKIRKDLHVDHKCVNRKCIRYSHLKVCTPKTNMILRDKRNAQKNRHTKGKPNAPARRRTARGPLVCAP